MLKKLFKTTAAFALAATMMLSSSTSSMAYTIQAGDSLGKIAAENNISVKELMEINGISNANKIYVGEQIKVSKDDTTEVKLAKQNQTSAQIPSNVSKMIKDMFDAEEYAKMYPDVVKALGTDADKLYEHFVTHGIWEGRQPNKEFNVSAYASAYRDLTWFAGELGLNEEETLLFMYEHYNNHGKTENRKYTTVEAASQAGITVKSIATAEDAEGKPMAGTVISAPASAPAASPAPAPYAPTAEQLALVAALSVSVNSKMELEVTSSRSLADYTANNLGPIYYVNGQEVVGHYGWLIGQKTILAHMLGDSGDYTVTLDVYDNDAYEVVDSITETFSYTKPGSKLANPTNVSYDAGNGKVTWDSVPNATGYYVEIIQDGYNWGGDNCLWYWDSSAEYDIGNNVYLEACSSAVIRIRAYADINTYESSDWVEFTVK